MYMQPVAGIDPGKNGAIAILNEGVIYLGDFPMVEYYPGKNNERKKTKSKGGPQIVTEIQRDRMLAMLSKCRNGTIWIEYQDSHQQGSKSAFTSGRCYEAWYSGAFFVGAQIIEVRSKEWHQKYGLAYDKTLPENQQKKDLKRRSWAWAIDLFPQSQPFLKRNKDIDRAEALLLLAYGIQRDRLEISSLSDLPVSLLL